MNAMQRQHFGLERDPFDKRVGDSDLWLPPSKEHVVQDLCDAVHARQWSLLVGEPGVGKTCVLRALRHRLDADQYRLTYCHNSTLGRRDFYRQICHALGLAPKATAAAVFYAITTHIAEIAREQHHPVLLIDEAHLLRQPVLDHLHILGNYDWDASPLLTIILVGLPDLEDQLRLRRNRSLYSRLGRRQRISPLRPQDTADYLRTRLALAGCDREVFTADATAHMHEAVAGTLRDLDRVADLSLRLAADRKEPLAERHTVAAAARADKGLTEQ